MAGTVHDWQDGFGAMVHKLFILAVFALIVIFFLAHKFSVTFYATHPIILQRALYQGTAVPGADK